MDIRERMSPTLRARLDEDDRQFAAAAREAERLRAQRAEAVEEQNLQLAMRMAMERGEYFSPTQVARSGGACLGRTRAEAVAYRWALAEAEEARQAREAARSAPVLTEADIAQRHAAMIAANPFSGRTKQEALAYFSAVQDLEDIDAARNAAKAKADAEQSAREKLEAQYHGRARDRHLRDTIRAVAQGEIYRDRERRYINGQLTA